MKIVAELGAAHNGSLDHALEWVDAAAQSGADCIKLQTWTDNEMDAGERILDSGPWKGRSLSTLYRVAHTPYDWHRPVIDYAQSKGLDWHSSVFDYESLEFLEKLGCPRYKIASFELVDTPLIRAVASTGKPMILSTGMATMSEIHDAVAAAHPSEVTLLKCVSAYPASAEDFNLTTMVDMGIRWECNVGLSDHTRSPVIPVAAAVMGASMIERHLTTTLNGLDDGFASLPADFATMSSSVRMALEAIGRVKYGPAPSESPSCALRRSLWVVRDIRAGECITPDNVRSRRPADGLEPRNLFALIGKRVHCDIKAGTPMRWDYLVP